MSPETPAERRLRVFEMAVKAFGLFSLDERRRALTRFASLQYPSIEDRFFEAVHSVIVSGDTAKVDGNAVSDARSDEAR